MSVRGAFRSECYRNGKTKAIGLRQCLRPAADAGLGPPRMGPPVARRRPDRGNPDPVSEREPEDGKAETRPTAPATGTTRTLTSVAQFEAGMVIDRALRVHRGLLSALYARPHSARANPSDSRHPRAAA